MTNDQRQTTNDGARILPAGDCVCGHRSGEDDGRGCPLCRAEPEKRHYTCQCCSKPIDEEEATGTGLCLECEYGAPSDQRPKTNDPSDRCRHCGGAVCDRCGVYVDGRWEHPGDCPVAGEPPVADGECGTGTPRGVPVTR